MRPPENIDVNLRIILERILNKLDIKSVDRIQQILNSSLKGMGHFVSS
jgi:hypothetical protein